MPQVKYWKTSDSAAAKVTKARDGSLVMYIEGEDEVFPGFPRGHSLYGSLSPLKHQIKNQIFNWAWAELERKVISKSQIISSIKHILLTGLTEFWEDVKYDAVPPEKQVPPVRELWRVLTKLEESEPKLKTIKEMLCFILQEDDAYRFRWMWLTTHFKSNLENGLTELENAEVIGDMKERIRLLKRITLLLLTDKKINNLFKQFCKEVNWNKLKLTKADKYHFRGKYYRVDLDKFEY